ncbi:MAG: hypothetical protein IJR85_05560 [Synergistaceae bacterium]|nr:hypothetical protein [Synergistaceae bacterium]
MHSNNINDMLREGFTEKFARYYLEQIEAENNSPLFERDYADWAHSMGFLAHNAYICGLTPDNVNEYLSDYDYYRIWPLNNWSRIWINDKLTLKYILAGTEFDGMMPEYYYYSSGKGLRKLMDSADDEQDIDALVRILKRKKALACKPNNSSGSQGFVKLSFNGTFFIDGQATDEAGIAEFVSEHKNYIFTEYLEPAEHFRRIYPKIHTLRVITVNEHGNDPYIAASYIRFPNSTSGSANYRADCDDVSYNLFTDVDVNSGTLGGTRKVFAKRTESVNVHPDTGIEISANNLWGGGTKEKILGIAKLFSLVEYMGFDIGLTDRGPKIMEINSHPGIGYLQMFRGFFTDERLGKYFRAKIDMLEALSEREKLSRNGITR